MPGPAGFPGTLLRARWFDGRSSQARPVLVSFEPAPPGQRGPDLCLHPVSGTAATPAGGPLRIPFRSVAWPPAWSPQRVQRTALVDLGGHGSLEVDAVAPWHAAFAAAGGRSSLAQQMQTRWAVLLGGLVVAALALGLFYRYGTPWAATQLTRYVPMQWEADLSTRALAELDRRTLGPSTLAPERQAALRQGFDALTQQLAPGLQRDAGYAPRWQLVFRAGMGANAFALPGGTVVLTDGLVRQAAAQGLGDDALLGVLAHEIGHVIHRHTTRMVVEQGVLNIGLGLALGDASVLMSTGSSLLTGLAYRRQHETEADCFSVALMRQARRSTVPMADLLLALSGAKPAGGAGASKAPQGGDWTSLLSSHPDTAGRALQLKQAQPEGCASSGAQGLPV